MQGNSHEQDKNEELTWHERGGKAQGRVGRAITGCSLIYNRDRISHHYRHSKIKMADLVRSHIGTRRVERLLIAPCGDGGDLDYLGGFGEEIHGIDLSPVATGACPPGIKTRTGDILASGYPDEYFDLVASPFFFHHLRRVGFDSFLREFYRVLKPGGGFISIEPSLWCPMNLLTRPIKWLFRNPLGEVPDEGPIRPVHLENALRRVGFTALDTRAASFSHCVIPVPIAKAIEAIAHPMLGSTPGKRIAWNLAFWAEKPAGGRAKSLVKTTGE